MEMICTCFGAGLVALDVILNGSPITVPKLSTGGSCGNVLSILSYLGWNSYPIARLADDEAGAKIIHDLKRWNVHTDHISINKEGSTPIVIHRILKNKSGKPIHRFEFRDPETKSWLPQFKAITKKEATEVIEQNLTPHLFYFDRMNPGTLQLATYLKTKGTIIFFEPSSIKDQVQFEKFLFISDIVKLSNDRIPDFKERYPEIQCFLEIETLGKDGLAYRSKNNTIPNQWNFLNGFNLNEIQDAAGAGDWCSSGIIYNLCSKGNIKFYNSNINEVELSLQFGQALGALNCLYDGARGLMYQYTYENLLALVNKFIIEKDTSKLKLAKQPVIDISTNLLFSELYQYSK